MESTRKFVKGDKLRKTGLLFLSIIVLSACPCCNGIISVPWSLDVGLTVKRLTRELRDVENVGEFLRGTVEGFYPFFKEREFKYNFPDTHKYKDPIKVIQDNKFEVSRENIKSSDGFILTAWRIQCRKNCGDPKKYPVLLQHGLFCSGADWLYLDPKYVLPFLLADAGYEVWIGNARGTKYSQNHTKYTAQDSKFWEHSVHEMGEFDVPASINRIKEVTKKDKVNYVGYSMGTTMFFIYQSTNPDHYARNVNRFVGLAPAMYISNMATKFKLLGPVLDSDLFHLLLRKLGVIAKLPVDGPLKTNPDVVFNILNALGPFFVPFAKKVLTLESIRSIIYGDPLIKNTPAVQRAIGYFPENISIRTVRHYAQFFTTKTFGNFEYKDVAMNLLRYKNAKAPGYNVGDVQVPSLFIGGLHDPLVVAADFEYTMDEIEKCNYPKCATVKYNMVPCFTHLDFIWGPNNGTKTLVYDQVVRWFDETWDESYWPEVKRRSANSDYCRERYLNE